MNKLQRTTITLPDDLLQWAKITAARHRLSVSDVVREGMIYIRQQPERLTLMKRKRMGEGLRQVMGSLKLGGKEPYKHRSDLYEDHLRRKFSS